MIVQFDFVDGYRSEEVTFIFVDNAKYLLKEGNYVKIDAFTIDCVNWYLFAPYGIPGYKWSELAKWLLDTRAVNFLITANEAEIALGLGNKKVIDSMFVNRCLDTWNEDKKSVVEEPLPAIPF